MEEIKIENKNMWFLGFDSKVKQFGHFGYSFLGMRVESLAVLTTEPGLKSRMYFWDLKRVALGSLLKSTLDEFQIVPEAGVLLTKGPGFMEEVTWPDIDLDGSIIFLGE